jgi:hypothetical protein
MYKGGTIAGKQISKKKQNHNEGKRNKENKNKTKIKKKLILRRIQISMDLKKTLIIFFLCCILLNLPLFVERALARALLFN